MTGSEDSNYVFRYPLGGAVKFALVMSQMEVPVDYSTITDRFLQRYMMSEATTFLLDVLKPNLPEHGFLQTKVKPCIIALGANEDYGTGLKNPSCVVPDLKYF